jgi:putative transposase
VVLVALGFDAQGKKHVLGIREGSTEKTQVVRSLLSDLIERGLDADAARLWVIDGSKALRRAILEVFGTSALVQRCQEHKRRNVLDHLPEDLHPSVGRAMNDAWQSKDPLIAKRQLERLASSLAKNHPGAAASLREGLAETLTLVALGVDDALYRTLRTTNPIENLNGSIAHYTRNVKRWRDGHMLLRWVASSLHEAGRGFRAVRGYRDMKRLIAMLAQSVQSDSAAQLKSHPRPPSPAGRNGWGYYPEPLVRFARRRPAQPMKRGSKIWLSKNLRSMILFMDSTSCV